MDGRRERNGPRTILAYQCRAIRKPRHTPPPLPTWGPNCNAVRGRCTRHENRRTPQVSRAQPAWLLSGLALGRAAASPRVALPLFEAAPSLSPLALCDPRGAGEAAGADVRSRAQRLGPLDDGEAGRLCGAETLPTGGPNRAGPPGTQGRLVQRGRAQMAQAGAAGSDTQARRVSSASVVGAS